MTHLQRIVKAERDAFLIAKAWPGEPVPAIVDGEIVSIVTVAPVPNNVIPFRKRNAV